MQNDILKGIRILDFTRVLAGPFATRILADFGAEVIKVQSKKTATGAESNDSGYFNTWNRNKKSITLDLTFSEARMIFLKLVAISDVVIENFSPRVMSNFDLTYEHLKKEKDDLIMLSISGMGQTGPWKDYVAYGPTVQSFGGLSYLSSFDAKDPMGLGNSYGDPVVGLYGAFTVLSALEYRDKTGQGLYLDLSGYESVCTSIASSLLDASVNKTNISPEGNSPDYVPAAPYGCFRCKGEDRWCAIAIFNDFQWKSLGKILGEPGWMNEKKFSSISARKKNGKALHVELEKWTLKNSPEEIADLLQDAGISSGVVQNAEDLVNDPHLDSRNFFVPLDHPFWGDTLTDNTPIHFDKEKRSQWKSAPLLGEDNQYVYQKLLGLQKNEVLTYVEKGIIG